MAITVLITGFSRFPGAPFNPSGPLARAVARRQRPAFADVRRILHIFETSYAAVDRDLPKLIARHKPDIMLMFGLAGRTAFVRVETRARNARSTLFPDVTGFRPDERTIVPRVSAARGRAPFIRLVAAARATRVPTRLSHDAGRYLCNYVYWRALEASRSGTLAQFIHIPPVSRVPRRSMRDPEKARPGLDPGKPAIGKEHAPARKAKRRATPAALARAGEAILLALLAAQRRLG